MNRLLFSFLAICMSFNVVSAGPEDDGFTNFLTDKMRDYTTWLSNNNLDPSPVMDESIMIRSKNSSGTVNIVTFLSSIRISGHSNQEEDSSSAAASFADKVFRVQRTTIAQFQGDFVMDGMINEDSGYTFKFSAHGRFTIPQKEIIEEWSMYTGFQEVSDHFDISRPNLHVYVFASNSDPDKIEFEGLFDDERLSLYAPQISNEIVTLFDEYRSESLLIKDHPANKLLEKFLQEKFDETSVKDIVVWPAPEP